MAVACKKIFDGILSTPFFWQNRQGCKGYIGAYAYETDNLVLYVSLWFPQESASVGFHQVCLEVSFKLQIRQKIQMKKARLSPGYRATVAKGQNQHAKLNRVKVQ